MESRASRRHSGFCVCRHCSIRRFSCRSNGPLRSILGGPGPRDRLTDLADRSSHHAGILEGSAFSVFVKLSHAVGAGAQFSAELAGLELIRDRARVLTPTPIGPGVIDVPGGAVLLLEAIQERTARTERDWTPSGEPSRRSTGCGPTNSGWNYSTASSVRCRRTTHRRVAAVGPISSSSVGSSPGSRVPSTPVTCRSRLPATSSVWWQECRSWSDPNQSPTLLHGDAQQNNFLSTAAGAVVIDAAPYFGHPEVDLAMLDFFAPVPDAVFRRVSRGAIRSIRNSSAGESCGGSLPTWPSCRWPADNDFGRGFLRRLVGCASFLPLAELDPPISLVFTGQSGRQLRQITMS